MLFRYEASESPFPKVTSLHRESLLNLKPVRCSHLQSLERNQGHNPAGPLEPVLLAISPHERLPPVHSRSAWPRNRPQEAKITMSEPEL